MQMPIETDRPVKQISNQKRSFLCLVKKISVGILLILCAILVYRVCNFLFGGGLFMSSAMKVLSLFWWMLKKVFFATFLYLIPPILVSIVVYILSANKVLRFLMGVGSIYLFYLSQWRYSVFPQRSFGLDSISLSDLFPDPSGHSRRTYKRRERSRLRNRKHCYLYIPGPSRLY